MELVLDKYATTKVEDVKVWFKAASVNDFPQDGGACVKYKDKQIAVFNFAKMDKWYACQNVCPHKMEMVLSRGMIGDDKGIPKVACPLHKKTFSLENGENLNGDMDAIATYPVKIEGENVYIGFSE
ncbi:nitrite reductase small subunit NirD [Tamlana sp. s12]|uniref:Nitrite reductase (NAD(P)H) small subunit n=1 Tax=Pseudotamlana carrageenivorans TaxID=2069432 RepID=A0A2I7SM36_9FLAO|nr:MULTISPECIES: nitrite reductase small subunit NirD [Tamlana]AUS06973.1 nitrite reductase (NAD(P)H) small subunit [Tamlana carrageenivorans]OBQ56411.1 nitrite reductase [Tamlana sp. s12]QQY81965.1 nitrite reductase small subunit NirD [Tamlana sp. s12]